MWLAAALIVLWLILRGRRSALDFMEKLNFHKPGPPYRNTVQLVYIHWRYVRLACLQTPTTRNAAALARAWRAAGLTQLFQSMGYCWRALAAISVHETGYGTSHVAYEHDNLWGVSYKGPAGPMVPYTYESIAHSAEHLIAVLNLDRYAQARAAKSDGRVFLVALHDAGYNSSQQWLDGVLAAYGELLIV
jgi:hypothetical protein